MRWRSSGEAKRLRIVRHFLDFFQQVFREDFIPEAQCHFPITLPKLGFERFSFSQEVAKAKSKGQKENKLATAQFDRCETDRNAEKQACDETSQKADQGPLKGQVEPLPSTSCAEGNIEQYLLMMACHQPKKSQGPDQIRFDPVVALLHCRSTTIAAAIREDQPS